MALFEEMYTFSRTTVYIVWFLSYCMVSILEASLECSFLEGEEI